MYIYATLFNVVFCYLYIETTFSYTRVFILLFSNHLIVYYKSYYYIVICLYFIIHLKAMNLFDMK